MNFNPIELDGNSSLFFNVALLLVGTIASYFVRRLCFRQAGTVPSSLVLSAGELGYLAEGPERAMLATLAGLIDAGHVDLDTATGLLSLRDANFVGRCGLEASAINVLKQGPTSANRICLLCSGELNRTERRLERAGLIWDKIADQTKMVPGLLVASVSPIFAFYMASFVTRTESTFLPLMMIGALGIGTVVVHFLTNDVRIQTYGTQILEAKKIELETGQLPFDMRVAIAGVLIPDGPVFNKLAHEINPPKPNWAASGGCGGGVGGCGSHIGDSGGCGGGGCGGGGCGS